MAGATTGPAIVAHGLTKHYGDVMALDGLDLEVAAGTVMAARTQRRREDHRPCAC